MAKSRSYGGTRSRNAGIMNSNRLEMILRAHYLHKFPQLAPIATDIQLVAKNCPDRDNKKPFTLENDDRHVQECANCRLVLEAIGKPYPK